jgi:hypothetical protein
MRRLTGRTTADTTTAWDISGDPEEVEFSMNSKNIGK